MKHGLGGKKAGQGGLPFIPAQLRARFKGGLPSRRQTAGKYGVARRGATLLTLTLSRFAAHRAPVLHRFAPIFGR